MKKHKKGKRKRTIHFMVTIPLSSGTFSVTPYSVLEGIQAQPQEEVNPLDPKSITPFDEYLYRTFVQKEEEIGNEQ